MDKNMHESTAVLMLMYGCESTVKGFFLIKGMCETKVLRKIEGITSKARIKSESVRNIVLER